MVILVSVANAHLTHLRLVLDGRSNGRRVVTVEAERVDPPRVVKDRSTKDLAHHELSVICMGVPQLGPHIEKLVIPKHRQTVVIGVKLDLHSDGSRR